MVWFKVLAKCLKSTGALFIIMCPATWRLFNCRTSLAAMAHGNFADIFRLKMPIAINSGVNKIWWQEAEPLVALKKKGLTIRGQMILACYR